MVNSFSMQFSIIWGLFKSKWLLISATIGIYFFAYFGLIFDFLDG